MNELDRMFDALLRHTVGYDFLTSGFPSQPSYPPYDVIRDDEHHYKIQVALAGYSPEDVDIEQSDRTLVISNVRSDNNKDDSYLHRGIAKRNFRLQFMLAEHVDVRAASFENGLLVIELERQLPEKLQPRKIPVESRNALEYKAA